MHVDHLMSMAMKAWVNLLSHIMVMNLSLNSVTEEPINSRFFIENEYDFIVGNVIQTKLCDNKCKSFVFYFIKQWVRDLVVL